MRDIKVVIGANFGDEGKGLMTDYFCSRFPVDKKVLNVRFNGGAQAGHTVVTPDDHRHIFSHFGSGSFLPNVATYLSRDFIVNPILFRREYEKLTEIGVYPMVYVHPYCLITMPQDMMINQFLEIARGSSRHGSCGVGIFETKIRSKLNKAENVGHIMYTGAHNIDLDYYDGERFEKILNIPLSKEMKSMMINQNIMAHFQEDVRFFMNHVNVLDEQIFMEFDNAVFEGAQGLMLDQNNMDYFPHLTPSNTGVKNVLPYIDPNKTVEVCYVTRPYLTRHGAGKLPNECSMAEAGAKPDLTNHTNDWQGSLRYGKMDWDDFKTRCLKDFESISNLAGSARLSYCITHMDETGHGMPSDVLGNSAISVYDSCSTMYCSDGPTREDVHMICQVV